MTTKAKYRLFSILTWIIVVLTAVISLTLLFSAQLFVERDQKSWANLWTVTGSGLLALVNLYIGARLQEKQNKDREKRSTRKSVTQCHREFIQAIDSLAQQLKRIPHFERQHDLDGADMIRYDVHGQLVILQKNIPSSANVDKSSREVIESAISSITDICEKLIEKVDDIDSSTWMPYLSDLSCAIDTALLEIESYEEHG